MDVNAEMSRLPIGVVNLLRGQPAPRGPSLRQAYAPFDAAAVLSTLALGALAWWAARARRGRWALLMVLVAVALFIGLQVVGLSPAMLAPFAPDLALSLAAAGALLCVPAALRASRCGRLSPQPRDER